MLQSLPIAAARCEHLLKSSDRFGVNSGMTSKTNLLSAPALRLRGFCPTGSVEGVNLGSVSEAAVSIYAGALYSPAWYTHLNKEASPVSLSPCARA